MSACNNTTYARMVFDNEELQLQFHKYSFFTGMLEFNVPTAMMINKTVTPIWIVLGTFGNILSALVWSSTHMRTCPTIAYYLTCLSLADLTFLVIQIFVELEAPWLVGTLDAQGWCQIFSVINISVQYFCVFLVSAFTIERFLSICYPFKSERFGKTRTPRVIMFLLALCVILGIPQAYFWDLNKVGECQIRREVNTMTTLSFYSIFTWFTELAIFGVLPILVLFLNIAVIFKINQIGKIDLNSVKIGSKSGETLINRHNTDSKRMAGSLSGEKGSKELMNRTGSNGSATMNANANHRSTTITLLCVSFFLIFTMLPNTIVYALQHSVRFGPMPCRIEDMGQDPRWRSYFTYQTVKFIIKEISLSHHVANVFIYMATSSRFFRQVMSLMHIRSRRCWSRSSPSSSSRGRGEQAHQQLNTSSYRMDGSINNHCRYTQHTV